MDRIKKLNGSMIAATVLSVLLLMSITMTATLAWFASRDNATRTLTMGEAVVVTISDQDEENAYRQGKGVLAMQLPVNEKTNGLLPGMRITPNIKVQLQGSNTNALLRARFITTVEYPNNYVDAAYADTNKYPDKDTESEDGPNSGKEYVTTSGAVLDPAVFPDDHIYAGTISYDYYDYQGRLIKYVEWNGTSEKPTPGAGDVYDKADIVASDGKYALDEDGDRVQNGFYGAEGDNHSITIQLYRVKVRDSIVNAIGGTTTIAGVANTAVSAQNAAEMEIRQRGYDLTEAINTVLNGELGKIIDPTTGEVIDGIAGQTTTYSRRVADGWAYRQADKAWYYLGSATNGFVLQNQTGTSEALTGQIAANDITAYTATTPDFGSPVYLPTYTALTTSETHDKTRNYLGAPNEDTGVVDATDNETAVMKQASIASIDLSKGNVSIDFLTKPFSLPTFINNDYAKARVTFTFTVEAVQDYLIDPKQEQVGGAERIPNNLANAILVFNNAYPATKADGEASLADTGTYYNVIPGTGLGTFPNKGYATKQNDDGDDIANYMDGTAAYVLGTASSLGVQTNGQPNITIGTPQPPQP